jgi:trigger factor
MVGAVQTATHELPGSRVRIEATVEAAELQKRVAAATRTFARDLRVPGFRKGKAPAEIVVGRVGWPAVLEEALRDALPAWYERALLESGAAAIGEPDLDVPDMPAEGEALSFTIEVAVRPQATLGDYKGLEVGRAEPEIPAEAIDAEIEQLREGFASLRPVERAATEGDFLLVDYTGALDGEPIDGAEAHDFLLELGSESLLEGFGPGLEGATAGERRDVEITFPDDYRPENLAGQTAVFDVVVKEVREKDLPELDDDFAAEASDFDTLAALREDLGRKIGELAQRRVDEQFREAAVDAVAAAAEITVPDDVVGARAEEIWSRVERSLQERGISPETYLSMQGKSRSELLDEARPDAEQGIKREAVLAAVADAERIEITDEDLLETLGGGETETAADGDGPAKALRQLRSSGRDALLRDDLRLRRAAELVAEEATPIPLAQAEAREQIWTPDKEREGRGELWTPGQRTDSE